MNNTKTADLVLGIGICVLGVAVFVAARSLPSARFGLGSGGYPMLVGVLLAGMGALQAILTIAKGGINFQISPPKDMRGSIKITAITVSTFIYVYLLNYLGFLLLTPFYLFGTTILFGYRRYLLAAMISICVTVSIHVMFTRVFMIFLPTFRL